MADRAPIFHIAEWFARRKAAAAVTCRSCGAECESAEPGEYPFCDNRCATDYLSNSAY